MQENTNVNRESMKFKIDDECGFELLFQRRCVSRALEMTRSTKNSYCSLDFEKCKTHVKGIFYLSLTLQKTILVITNVVQVSVTIRNK